MFAILPYYGETLTLYTYRQFSLPINEPLSKIPEPDVNVKMSVYKMLFNDRIYTPYI